MIEFFLGCQCMITVDQYVSKITCQHRLGSLLMILIYSLLQHISEKNRSNRLCQKNKPSNDAKSSLPMVQSRLLEFIMTR